MGRFSKKILSFVFIAAFVSLVWFWAGNAFAQPDLGLAPVGESIGLPATDIRLIIARIIRALLGLLGIVAVVLVLWAGYLWMTAGGDEEKVATAKSILRNAVIGLAIILSSYAIVSFVMSKLLEATGGLPAHCYNGIQDAGETGVDCGGECGACGEAPPCTGTGCYSWGTDSLYVRSIMPGKKFCVSNVGVWIRFSRDVSTSTLVNNIVVQRQARGTYTNVAGEWMYAVNISGVVDESHVFFRPTPGACPGVDYCFAANATYRLTFVNSGGVTSRYDPLRSLQCSVSHPCPDVIFETGESVDVTPPVVQFIYPPENTPFKIGETVPVRILATDNAAVGSIALSVIDMVDGANRTRPIGEFMLTDDGCAREASTTINWPTASFAKGIRPMVADAFDQTERSNTAVRNAQLLPEHCYNEERDEGDGETGVDCGGECGCCPDASCNDAACGRFCASGYCELSTGKCADRLTITGVTPASGASATLVSIAGRNFGDNAGQVYFSRVEGPSPANDSDWILATGSGCSGVDTWTPRQILVEVPPFAVTGPIKVRRANAGTDIKNVDYSNDDWGPYVANFTVNNLIRPALCSVMPRQAAAGDVVNLFGRRFGPAVDSPGDKIMFGESVAAAVAGSWLETIINARVPNLEKGDISVKVKNNDVDSNSLRFTIITGEEEYLPTITDVSPAFGPPGTYITITGKNFGENTGRVWFGRIPGGGADASGSFDFPSDCDAAVWNDNKIIVKFPRNTTAARNIEYYIFVNTADNLTSTVNEDARFGLIEGSPRPGICKISPVSGPIPFAQGQYMEIIGEYFGDNVDNIEAYFWKAGASENSITGRAPATNNILEDASGGGDRLLVRPPDNTGTGPVVVHLKSDPMDVFSKPGINFSVFNCVNNKNKCANENDTCCTVGADRGACRPEGDLCEGGERESGYIWRFCTQDIPKVPQVRERCDNVSEAGDAFPSPSPSILWDTSESGPHHNACKTATILVEFTVGGMNSVTTSAVVDDSLLLVRECVSSTVATAGRTCVPAAGLGNIRVKTVYDNPPYGDYLTPRVAFRGPNEDGADYLELSPINYNGGQWKEDTWYQVVLKKSISATDNRGNISYLAADKPCDGNGVSDSAYCFLFKTGDSVCRVRDIIVAPYKYWTTVLEAPIKNRSGAGAYDLFYSGHALSDQRCIMMDTSGYSWNWGPGEENEYAEIYDGGTTRDQARVSAKQNTVGVGLASPLDAVNIFVTASTGTTHNTGYSPLTIDLSDPRVVDFWPNCNEACTNADVGAKFNTTMSRENVSWTSVRLYECLDENCLSLSSPLTYGAGPSFNAADNLTLAIPHAELLPNKIYKVILSTSTTPPASPAANPLVLWSAKQLGHPETYAKPFNKEFSWKFRTKDEKCLIDRVAVEPVVFVAPDLTAQSPFEARIFSKPDNCNAKGQELSAWSVNWSWTTSDANVATVKAFRSRYTNAYCTAYCVRKGSDIPSGLNFILPVCGNGIVEAGEDCDPPGAGTGCSLNCLRMGNSNGGAVGEGKCGNGVVEPENGEECDTADSATKIGCSTTCLHTGSRAAAVGEDTEASVCGNSYIGSGEDCDLGVAASTIVATSSLLCSPQCLHMGTRLSSKWCFDHSASTDMGGFTPSSYRAACDLAYSQCGDGVKNPDEDPECDGISGWNEARCDEYCILKRGDSSGDGGVSDSTAANDCAVSPLPAGCDRATRRHIGSSLLYSNPSICGDGAVGLGEDAFCETFHTHTLDHERFNPWALAMGVGNGTATGNPLAQRADISATTNEQTSGGPKTGKGEFQIPCGYTSDAECARFNRDGIEYGVSADSCCRPRPRLVSVYPAHGRSFVCPNTYIEAVFDQKIDPASLSGNLLIAQGGGTEAPTARKIGELSLSGSDIHAFKIKDNYAFVLAQGYLHSLDITSSTPSFVASIPLPFAIGSARIAAGENYLFALSSQKLYAVDISNPRVPQKVNDGNPILDFTAALNLGASAVGTGLEAIGNNLYAIFYDYTDVSKNVFAAVDISEISSPALRGSLRHGADGAKLAHPVSLAIAGQYAYVISASNVAADAVLEVVDISNVSALRHVGYLSHEGGGHLLNATAVAVRGNYAYIAMDNSTSGSGEYLSVVDVSDKINPRHSSVLAQAGGIRAPGLVVSGDYVNLPSFTNASGAQHKIVKIVNISDPFRPVGVYTISVGNNMIAAGARGDRLYLAGQGAVRKMFVYDLSDFTVRDCSGDNDVTHLLRTAFAGDELPWYKKLWRGLIAWTHRLFGGDARANQTIPGNGVSKWCMGGDTGVAKIVTEPNATTTRVAVTLQKPLSFGRDYAIILKNGIKSDKGVSISSIAPAGVAVAGAGGSLNYKFFTDNQICEVDSLSVVPAEVYLSATGENKLLEVDVRSDNNQRIQPVDGYRWNYLWSPEPNELVKIADIAIAANVNTTTAKNQNGEIDVYAVANIIENNYTGILGQAADGKSHHLVFLCQNPWPPKGKNIDGQNINGYYDGVAPLIPYRDAAGYSNYVTYNFASNKFEWSPISLNQPYYNFSTYYCADAGGNTVADDLPYLKPAKQINIDGALKRFIMSNDKNKDAIGVQVFPNPAHLTARQWYANSEAYGGREFGGQLSDMKVDGYDAVSDGNNIYVDALNLSPASIGSHDYFTPFTNIYLISINSDAQPETRQAFEQFVANFKFNINFENQRYCGKKESNGTIVASTTAACGTDFDCQGSSYSICLNSIDKIKRNYERLRDLQLIQGALENYSVNHPTTTPGQLRGNYPELTEGTYLSGQTISTWPSWGVLGNAVGTALPADPVNRLAPAGTCKAYPPTRYCLSDANCTGLATTTCAFHDPTTGWSTEDRRFSFACNPQSLSYRYIFSTSTGYEMRASIEPILFYGNYYSPFTDANWQSSFSEMLDFTKVKVGSSYGICSQNNEVATFAQGRCGDGQVNLNLGESCDPPGTKTYDDTACAGVQWGARCETHRQTTGACNYNSSIICTSESDCPLSFFTIGDTIFFPQSANSTGVCGAQSGFSRPAVFQYTGRPAFLECKDDSDCEAIYNGPTSPLALAYVDWVNGITAPRTVRCVEQTRQAGSCNRGGTEKYCTMIPGGVKHTCTADIDCTNQVRVRTCNSQCGWTDSEMLCSDLALQHGQCGNGLIDFGEACDDGRLNGTYNHCKTDCSGKVAKYCGNGVIDQREDGSSPYEVCDIKSGMTYGGLCVGTGVNGRQCAFDADCQQSCLKNGVLGSFYSNCVLDGGTYQSNNFARCVDTLGPGGKYGFNTRSNSCAFDCQSYGSFCGDKVAQSEWGETCDGDEACNIGSVSGQRKCLLCQKTSDAKNWWRFESRIGRETASSRASAFADSISSGRELHCDAGDPSKCPVISTIDNRVGNALQFDGVDDYLTTDAFSGDANWINPANQQHTITVAAWVKMDAGVANGTYMPIVSKVASEIPAGAVGAYADYYFGFLIDSGKIKEVRIEYSVDAKDFPRDDFEYCNFNESNGLPNITLGDWQHFAFTLDYLECKLYYNGELIVRQNVAAEPMLKSFAPIQVGALTTSRFKGKMDEVMLFDAALSPTEIKDIYNNNWRCVPSEEVAEAGVCGNGRVDSGEACDSGRSKNGVPCVAGYNQSCSYCSSDCKNVIDVHSDKFCGNGKIDLMESGDSSSAEQCELVGGNIWVSDYYRAHNSTDVLAGVLSTALDPTINGWQLKTCREYNNNAKGQKYCNSCHYENGCIICGQNTQNGRDITAKVVNALMVNGGSTNPLYGASGFTPKLELKMGNLGTSSGDDSVASVNLPVGRNDFTLNDILTDPVCSDDSEGGRQYKLYVNGNYSSTNNLPVSTGYDYNISSSTDPRIHDIVVVPPLFYDPQGNPQAGGQAHYNSYSQSMEDIRIVVSYLGNSNETGKFVGGFRVNSTRNIDRYSFNGIAVPATVGAIPSAWYFARDINSGYARGIWLHPFFTTGNNVTRGLAVESFTADTSKEADLDNNRSSLFKFYIQDTNFGEGIYSAGKDRRLKVEVYMPKPVEGWRGNDDDRRRILPPDFTFYVGDADYFENSVGTAQYWHVFNLFEVNAGEPTHAIGLINQIRTSPTDFIDYR